MCSDESDNFSASYVGCEEISYNKSLVHSDRFYYNFAVNESERKERIVLPSRHFTHVFYLASMSFINNE